MSKKKITSLLLSACMILSPILSPITVSAKEGDPGGVETVSGGDLVYISEDFEDATKYPDGQIIASVGNTVESKPEPVSLGNFIFSAGRRTNDPNINCSISIGNVGTSRGIVVSEDGMSTAERGVAFSFTEAVNIPAASSLQDGETLELSMDFTSNNAFTIVGFGDISIPSGMPSDGLAHLKVSIGKEYNKVLITDAEGNVLEATKTAASGTDSITGMSFYKGATAMQIDNLVIAKGTVENIVDAPIYRLDSLEDVKLDSVQYAEGYSHPTAVKAYYEDGTTADVEIDPSSWISEPAFDANVEANYVWRANIIAPDGHANPKKLMVGYGMKYTVVKAEDPNALEIVYISEDFEDETLYPAGQEVIRAATSGTTTPVVKDKITYSAGVRAGIEHRATTISEGDNKYLDIFEGRWADAERGIKLTFEADAIPAISTLNEGETLELSMDFTASKSFGITGFGKVDPEAWIQTPASGLIHLRAIILNKEGETKLIETDSEGKIIFNDSVGTATGFTNISFCLSSEMTAKLDNIKIEKKAQEEEQQNENAKIVSVAQLAEVALTYEEYTTYTHPTTVIANLEDGSKIEVNIDPSTWTSKPAFDQSLTNQYTWSADIIAPENHENPNQVKATYKMNYTAPVTEIHDYINAFTFVEDYAGFEAWGRSMSTTSPTGVFGLSIGEDEDGYKYLSASASGTGGRGSKLKISNETVNGSDIVKGSEITFDWMPVSSNEVGYTQLMFIAPGKSHPYFTLKADTAYKILYYTENPLGEAVTTTEAFAGSISEVNAVDTGLSGAKKWFTVNLKFDYLGHTADLTITEKGTTNSYTQTGIPIEAPANGMEYFMLHMGRINNESGSVTTGIRNFKLDYIRFGASEVVAVTNPADVIVNSYEYDSYTFPSEVTVTLGDATTKKLPVGKWVSSPEFNKEENGVYQWTAEVITGDLVNVYNFPAVFSMRYTLLTYPTYVWSPATLELVYGEGFSLDTLPKTARALMSDGTYKEVTLSAWEPIRAFNAEEEGIYIYGAKIVPVEGEYQVELDLLTPNENPEDPAEFKKEIENYKDYNVYYRISYYKNESNNKNGYTRSMEYLNRGVYAITSDKGIFVSWRLLVDEYGEDISFNVFRNNEKIASGIDNVTYYIDANGKAGDIYYVEKVQDGYKYKSDEVTALGSNYLSIAMQKPDPQPNKNGELSAYTLNDAGVADVDGDGVYEFIVKWYPDNSFDSGQANGPSSPTIFDVYKMDGTALWRINLGLELPSGAHFNQFIFHDLDEDGKAEVFFKTSDGVITYKPNAEGKFDMTDESTIVSYIGDKNVVPGTNVNDNGHVNANSHEYVTVFNGLTGEEISTIDYVNVTGVLDGWGRTGDGGNRSARYNMGVAYLPKDQSDPNCTETIPAVIFNRGYYAKTTIAAYTLRDGKLQLEWNFVAENGTRYAGKGNHNLSTGDIDNDGFDEVIIGAIAIDHDGSVLWAKDGIDGQDYGGHADTIHLSAMFPDSDQLYIYEPQEELDSTINDSVSNAANGSRIYGVWGSRKDVGRAVAANITPNPGFEIWGADNTNKIYNVYGDIIAETRTSVSMNWVLYWDGDLLNELMDGDATEGNAVVTKFDQATNTSYEIFKTDGTKNCNWTKNSPSLTGDILGDWRDEIVVRSADDSELRIYMTDFETDYMIYSLMYDPVYHNQVTSQNTSYNQPAHLGFYLGEDIRDKVLNMELPVAKIAYTAHVEPAKTVDKDALASAIESAKTFAEKGGYTDSSAAELQTAKETAEAVYNNADASVADVQQAVANLNAAISKLEVKVVQTVYEAESKEITEANISDELKNSGFTTVESIENALKAKIQEKLSGLTVLTDADKTSGNAGEVNTKFMEITVMITITDSNGNKTTKPATKADFEKEGTIETVFAFPDEVKSAWNNYNFTVIHMFAADMNGHKAGEIEIPTVEAKADGLHVSLAGASPIAIAWQAKAASTNTETGVENNTQEDSSKDAQTDDSAKKTAPPTNDSLNAWAWGIVLLAALAGEAALFYTRRRKKEN